MLRVRMCCSIHSTIGFTFYSGLRLGVGLLLGWGAALIVQAQPLYQYQPPLPPPGIQVPPPQTAPTLWVVCALEEEICHIRKPTLVRYGINGRYVERTVRHSFFCTNDLFGDPAPSARKQCEVRAKEDRHNPHHHDHPPRYPQSPQHPEQGRY